MFYFYYFHEYKLYVNEIKKLFHKIIFTILCKKYIGCIITSKHDITKNLKHAIQPLLIFSFFFLNSKKVSS
jgi:ABC-type cobalamin transport system ATPase subunit